MRNCDSYGISRLSLSEATVSALLEIENRCFTVPWRREDFESALSGKLYGAYGCFERGELIGFTVFLTLFEDCELMNLAVLPEKRNAGIGRALLEKCLSEAENNGVRRVFLEVREHNAPAIALYEKTGFTMYGKRKNYYRLPTEDALLYVRYLNGKDGSVNGLPEEDERKENT